MAAGLEAADKSFSPSSERAERVTPLVESQSHSPPTPEGAAALGSVERAWVLLGSLPAASTHVQPGTGDPSSAVAAFSGRSGIDWVNFIQLSAERTRLKRPFRTENAWARVPSAPLGGRAPASTPPSRSCSSAASMSPPVPGSASTLARRACGRLAPRRPRRRVDPSSIEPATAEDRCTEGRAGADASRGGDHGVARASIAERDPC